MSLPWYKDGLSFQCTGCGKCCTGSPGYVWVTESEMEEMAALLQVTLKEFKIKYTRQKGNRHSLLERKTINGQYDCIFLENNLCKVYKGRPLQCRTFPWWQENLSSPESWDLAAKECEGINAHAPKVSFEEICSNFPD